MFDSHIHTTFSTDSKMSIEDALKRSKELNLGLIITEHMDLNYPDETIFHFNQEEYFKKYSKYVGQNLYLGIELGMSLSHTKENRSLIENYPFDYVIGSVHLVDDVDIYRELYYTGKTKQQAYIQYLKYMYACLKAHPYIDSLGHIDYITRYARYEDKEIYYEDFADYIDEILKLIISDEIALEINTRRFSSSSALLNLRKIYNRYYELGGRIVTMGSDSHVLKDIGSNFENAKELLESCCLRPVYFKNRTPEFI